MSKPTTLTLKNISKETQQVRRVQGGNKEPLAPGKSDDVENSIALSLSKAYPTIFRVEGTGVVGLADVLKFIKYATEEEISAMQENLEVKPLTLEKVLEFIEAGVTEEQVDAIIEALPGLSQGEEEEEEEEEADDALEPGAKIEELPNSTDKKTDAKNPSQPEK